jgi:5,10-methylenetetrahydromethanopterin reductase
MSANGTASKTPRTFGYDRAWVPDSQMIWSDCYATLALAAVNTKRIHIGTGVAIPNTRIAPVIAHSIASINQLAPGRVFLGIGTGHTGMRVMGQDPMPARQFREYLRVVEAIPSWHVEESSVAWLKKLIVRTRAALSRP